MTPSLRLLAVFVFGVASIAADAPTTHPANPRDKYDSAVAAADRVRDKSVEKARETFIKDLKAAQKSAMQQGNLALANAIEDTLQSDPAVTGKPSPDKGDKNNTIFNGQPTAEQKDTEHKNAEHKFTEPKTPAFVGSTWKPVSGGAFTFVADGSTTSSIDGPGHWKLLSETSVLVTFDDHPDWVRIFNFDDAGKMFKSTSYQQQQTDTGAGER